MESELDKRDPNISDSDFKFEREYNTFIIFHNIVTKSQMLPFFRFNSDEIIQRLKFFRQAFIEEIPDLWEYFEEEEIDPRNYVYEWIMTLYTRALSLKLAKRVWDLYFLDGFSVLFTTALAILKILKDKLLYAELEDIMQILKDAQYSITDEKNFIIEINKIQLPEWITDELKHLKF